MESAGFGKNLLRFDQCFQGCGAKSGLFFSGGTFGRHAPCLQAAANTARKGSARQRLAGEEPGEVAEVAVVVPRGIGFALRLAPRARVRARSKRGFWNTCIPVYV